ncbi:flagellar motor protein MotA [bacterium 336/3]|jgi:biopolymer transport protein ExbB|nr:flagellar motor protein MotA [bacterium 336/3]
MSTMKKKPSTFQNIFAGLAILVLFIVAVLIYKYFLGDPGNFEMKDGAPHPKNMFGTIYLGGMVVPVLMTCLFIVITFSIERFITIMMASGSGSITNFVYKVKGLLAENDVNGALEACDKQKGSIGNVVRSVLEKYKEMLTDNTKDKEQKVAAITKEQEDATALELPMLEKNLTIIATLASVATLIGLLGTVLGMIKAFSSMSGGGAAAAANLAVGISEALINTAIGIGTSAVAIIAYNYFTSKIDELTYNIDEVSYSILQNFNAQVK